MFKHTPVFETEFSIFLCLAVPIFMCNMPCRRLFSITAFLACFILSLMPSIAYAACKGSDIITNPFGSAGDCADDVISSGVDVATTVGKAVVDAVTPKPTVIDARDKNKPNKQTSSSSGSKGSSTSSNKLTVENLGGSLDEIQFNWEQVIWTSKVDCCNKAKYEANKEIDSQFGASSDYFCRCPTVSVKEFSVGSKGIAPTISPGYCRAKVACTKISALGSNTGSTGNTGLTGNNDPGRGQDDFAESSGYCACYGRCRNYPRSYQSTGTPSYCSRGGASPKSCAVSPYCSRGRLVNGNKYLCC